MQHMADSLTTVIITYMITRLNMYLLAYNLLLSLRLLEQFKDVKQKEEMNKRSTEGALKHVGNNLP